MNISAQDVEKDYYKVLGVTKSATPKEIKTAYRKLAKEFHPDQNPGDASAEERFKEISQAYEIVGNESKRKEYDQARELFGSGGRGAGPFGGGFRSSGFGPGGFSGFPGGVRFEDLGESGGYSPLFDLFNSQQGPRRGDDIEASINLNFEDSIDGLTTNITVTSDANCATCGGSGARPGTLPQTCPTCHGAGTMSESQGPFAFSRPCPTCHGAGQVIQDPCPTCHGAGTERRPRNIKVRIPPGVKDGQRIRLKGKGSPGQNGAPSGDLYLLVHVRQHEIFGRKGDNLTIAVPVTFPELALGSEIRVPTLDEPVKIKIPAGTRNGRTFKVKGRGAAKKGGGRGDLLVTVNVEVPQKLKGKEKSALEEFAALHSESPRSYLDQYME